MSTIPIHFEPNLLGVSRIFCTGCNSVLHPDQIDWRMRTYACKIERSRGYEITSDGKKLPLEVTSEYQWIKDTTDDDGPDEASDEASFKKPNTPIGVPWAIDDTDAPHIPTCPHCGTEGVIGDAIFGINTMRLMGETTIYPLRKGKRINVWKHVSPYKTKKGTWSEWKIDATASKQQSEAYSNFAEAVSDTDIRELTDAVDTDTANSIYLAGIGELASVYHWPKFSFGFLALCRRTGLVAIHNKRTWHGPRKLNWLKTRTGWASVKEFNEKLNDMGLSMNRGAFVIDTDIDSDTYLSSYWYDPSEDDYILVAPPETRWSFCRYDEAQGADDDEDEDDVTEPDDEPIVIEDNDEWGEWGEEEDPQNGEEVGEEQVKDEAVVLSAIVDRTDDLITHFAHKKGVRWVLDTLRLASLDLKGERLRFVNNLIEEIVCWKS